MEKPNVTRTYGPIHFEDLDPHRFEDLVRELIYDYKSWQSIEATGRGGNDEGFDVRAYEKVEAASQSVDEEGDEEVHPMDGNLWMIQCKREKEIGPKRIAGIITEAVDEKNPPYGYILAASANFSKDSYDTFREALKEKGVMEFYLWGRAEMEDMLHLPKNDRILFTFFGISLVSRRRSLATEVRHAVGNKNKLLKILDEGRGGYQSILVRDIKDAKYPYKHEYQDFKVKPRWKEYIVKEFHPLGLILRVQELYAFVDINKKQWDYTEAVNLIHRQSESDEEREENRDIQEKVESVWECFPRANQAKLVVYGMVRFSEILVIDERGDSVHKFPHIFVDFRDTTGPFAGFYDFLKQDENTIKLKGYTQIKAFPDSYSRPKFGKIYKSKSVVWNEKTLSRFQGRYEQYGTFYTSGSKYDFLKVSDVISIAGSKNSSGEIEYIQITHRYNFNMGDYFSQRGEDHNSRIILEEQIGRKIEPEENITAFEYKRVHKWQFESKSKK